MQLQNLDTFGDAVPLMSDAFFKHDQTAFVTAVESAKGAVASYPSLMSKLNQAVALFPSPQALESVLQAVAEVIELERQETRQRVLYPT